MEIRSREMANRETMLRIRRMKKRGKVETVKRKEKEERSNRSRKK